jgi:hypothetical protein
MPSKVLSLLCASLFVGHALAGENNRATCAGYIATIEAATWSEDPAGPQAYINMADSMYHRINTDIAVNGRRS